MSRPQLGKRVALLIVGVWGLCIGYIHIRHRSFHGHFAPLAIHADLIVFQSSIGIPGITKVYGATLTNYGLLPSLVERCNYISDTATPGAMVAYNIEQWNAEKRAWTRVMELATPELCTPELGAGSTKWRRSLLWPGRSIATGEEATGGRQPFKKGDTLRFVVVTDVTGTVRGRSSYPTPSFTLDEQRLDSEVPHPVSH